ncbi:MAG: peptidylprolyl isomerase [Phycisphaerales bacterium]|nr:peptidylprolyl isomerase [Hyphomonadaceae bacterium]
MRWQGLVAALMLAACASAEAPHPVADAPVRSLGEILEQSPAADWRNVDQNNLIYMQLPAGRVIIELAADYTPLHTANIQALARAHYWDGAAIVRSQENYVVQWGRDEADPRPMGEGQATLAPEFDRPRAGVNITRLVDPDTYAREVGFAHGFPVASNGRETWMTHCPGMVGAGRGDTADSGSGAELYVVIGHAPRHLDRNIATIGRVLQGMELLSVMPRGTGPLGFYETPEERTTIASVRLGSELPASERVNFEALRTDSATFRDVIESRRFRRESWFLDPVGHVNVCNVQLPVRVR